MPDTTKYDEPFTTIMRKYNERGMLRRIYSNGLGRWMDYRFEYDSASRIVTQYARGSADSDIYRYDPSGRLTDWKRNEHKPTGKRIIHEYGYDRVGNRSSQYTYESLNLVPTLIQNTSHEFAYSGDHSWKNQLTGVAGNANVVGGSGYQHDLTYNANGALIARAQRDTNVAGTYANERLESYAYDALGLVERFTLRSQQAQVSEDEDCGLSASSAPLNDWRYRFSPMAEREQKRQYANFNDSNALAWTYYVLGADAKQLSTWNGLEGDHCAQTNTVWLWPVERNGYGPGNTRIIIRQDSTREFVIADHLGSTRIVINAQREKLEEHDYEAFGGTIKHQGVASRTSYIGRETDIESDLGTYGVRMYSNEYGRFVSTDALWQDYSHVTPYQYSLNTPVTLFDRSGMAPEDPIWQMVGGGLSVVGGVAGIAGGIGLCLLPTGVSQILGGALIVSSCGAVGLGGAAFIEGAAAYSDNREAQTIYTSYESAIGTETDLALGGDGKIGGFVGGGLRDLATGVGVAKGAIGLARLGAAGAMVGEVAKNVAAPMAGLGHIGEAAEFVVKPKTPPPPAPLLSPEELRRDKPTTGGLNSRNGDGITSPTIHDATIAQ